MASSSQIKANRKNALRSTGPKTKLGKENIAKNALKYGLSLGPVFNSRDLVRIDQLAAALTGDSKNSDQMELAFELAKVQFECDRIRSARLLIIQNILKKERLGPSIIEQVGFRQTRGLVKRMIQNNSSIDEIDKLLDRKHLDEFQKTEAIINEFLQQLKATDRYLQRALASRKILIRQLYELK